MDAYFDCFSGISGDMTLGALVDLGMPVSFLRESIGRVLPETEFAIQNAVIKRSGIQATNITVVEKNSGTARDYQSICDLIGQADIPDAVRNLSLEMFSRIARAEAAIHGCPLENVHFHEVGGVDAIVDIVGTAFGVVSLEISKVIASPLPLGSGFVQCSHGRLPVPAPATLEILKGIPIRTSDIACELVTPTGAAIAVTLADEFGGLPAMRVAGIGYGSGKRDLGGQPNLLRILTGSFAAQGAGRDTEAIRIVETCIDDMNPEIYGFVMERLLEDGALDVYWIPIQMKKNRPGTLIQVLCSVTREPIIVDRLLMETTSIGVRSYAARRHVLDRREVMVGTPYGTVQAKQITGPDGTCRIVPEYEVSREIAREKDLPLQVVYETIRKAGETV